MCGTSASGPNDSGPKGSPAFTTSLGPAASRSFPPEVALHLVKMACERPDDRGRSLSFWDCQEMARQLAAEGIVSRISPDNVRRVMEHHHLAFLEQLDREIAAKVKTIHVVLDNLGMHKGKQVQAWLAKHPRFVFHHPPVHCSWMNQVEQWFSILQRKRLRIADFADKAVLAERLQAFIREWNQVSHPFKWTTKSVA
jgi:transposase